jgi:hypothetical protein
MTPKVPPLEIPTSLQINDNETDFLRIEEDMRSNKSQEPGVRSQESGSKHSLITMPLTPNP